MAGTVGRFRLLGVLGRGGCGVVYLAEDPSLGRRVALKVPRPEALFDPESRERFLREARAAAGLDHPNVVPVYETGEAGLVCYIASAYSPGPNLASWLAARPGPVPARQAAELVAALADGVAHAHDRRVLHRDLKPSNVLLTETPGGVTPRVADFGLAKLLDADDGTRTGAVLGTPAYMAPEQAAGRGGEVGPATDVWGLGAILYEVLTGRPPFGTGPGEVMLARALQGDPEPPRRARPDVPRALESVCLKCLARSPADRYAGPAELADDLRRFLRGEPVRAAPARGGLARWLRDPARGRDAGVYAIALNVVIALSVQHLALTFPAELLPPGGRDSLLLQSHAVQFAFHIPMMVIGWLVLGRRRAAAAAGAAWTAVLLAVFAAGLTGRYLMFPEAYGDYPLRRVVVYGGLSALFSVQLLGFLLAWANPGRTTG